MENIRIIKANDELSTELDYILCQKNKTDWKQGYKRICLINDEEPIEQGNKTDSEYYKIIHTPKYHYYLMNNNDIVGRAIISKRDNNFIDIQYILIEKEFRGEGYGTIFVKLLEQEILKDENIEGILIEDASSSEQTSKIAEKLGYEENSQRQFVKYRKSK